MSFIQNHVERLQMRPDLCLGEMGDRDGVSEVDKLRGVARRCPIHDLKQ